MYRTIIISCVFAVGVTMNGIAEEKIELRILKKKTQRDKVVVAGQELEVPPFDIAEVEIRNRSKEPLSLRWNIHVSQVFVPIVRDSTGQVVSNGASFGYSRSPRREYEMHTIPPGGVYRFLTHSLFETVTAERRRKGTYTVKLWLPPIDETKPESVLGKSWESNEITVDWDGE